jgi:hypothetical protein
MNTETTQEAVKIKTKLSLSQYTKVLFGVTYRMPVFIFLNAGGILFIAYYLLNGLADWFTVFVAVFLLSLPFTVFRSARKNYESMKALHEEIEYVFTEQTISASGQSFNSTMAWETLHKVRESKHFFLLFQNKQAAIMIPKTAFLSETDVNKFRSFARKYFPA